MPTAGGRNTVNFSANKGINVQGERSANMQAQQNTRSAFVADDELIDRVR